DMSDSPNLTPVAFHRFSEIVEAPEHRFQRARAIDQIDGITSLDSSASCSSQPPRGPERPGHRHVPHSNRLRALIVRCCPKMTNRRRGGIYRSKIESCLFS